MMDKKLKLKMFTSEWTPHIRDWLPENKVYNSYYLRHIQLLEQCRDGDHELIGVVEMDLPKIALRYAAVRYLKKPEEDGYMSGFHKVYVLEVKRTVKKLVKFLRKAGYNLEY